MKTITDAWNEVELWFAQAGIRAVEVARCPDATCPLCPTGETLISSAAA